MGKGRLFGGIALIGVAGYLLLKGNPESESVDLGGGFSGGGGDYGLMPTGYDEPEGAYDNTSTFPTGIVDEFMAQVPAENPFLGMTAESSAYVQPQTIEEVESFRKAGTPYNTIIGDATYGYGMASEDSFQIVDSLSKKESRTQASADLTRGILAQKDDSYVTLQDGNKFDPMGATLGNPSILEKPDEEKFNIFSTIGSFFDGSGNTGSAVASQPLATTKKAKSTKSVSSSKTRISSSGSSSRGSYTTSSGRSVGTTGKHFFSGRSSSSSKKSTKKKSRAGMRISKKSTKKKSRARRRIG